MLEETERGQQDAQRDTQTETDRPTSDPSHRTGDQAQSNYGGTATARATTNPKPMLVKHERERNVRLGLWAEPPANFAEVRGEETIRDVLAEYTAPELRDMIVGLLASN